MRTKPYAGEKVIYEPRKASWWGPGDLSVSQALFLNPIQQQQFGGGGMTNEQAQMMGKTIASNLNFNTQITNGQLNVVLDGGLG